MKRIYKFIAGNSRVTPAGIVLAAALALALRTTAGWWVPALYLAVLAATLAISTFEPVE